MNYLIFSIVSALFAVLYSAFLTYKIIKLPKGTPDMIEIADAIAEGASAYLKDNILSLVLYHSQYSY